MNVCNVTENVLISVRSTVSPAESKKSNWRQDSSSTVKLGDRKSRDTLPCSMFRVLRKYFPVRMEENIINSWFLKLYYLKKDIKESLSIFADYNNWTKKLNMFVHNYIL